MDLTAAFPAAMRPEVTRALSLLEKPRLEPSSWMREWFIGGERLAVPYRVYVDPPESMVGVPPVQRLVLNCLLSRHHDGYVRHRQIEALVWSREPWVLPYLFLPLGEYVVEIVLLIRAALSDVDDFGPFVAENPELFAVTRQRALSYWAEYNRYQYPKPGDYPAIVLLESMRRAADPAHRLST